MAKDVSPNINRTAHARRRNGWKMPFLSLVTLTVDLQTRLSEGPNTSSVWIRHTSVQRLRRYFVHKQKTTEWRCQKQNLPQFTACDKNWAIDWQKTTAILRPMSHLRQSHATLTCDKGSRVKVASVTGRAARCVTARRTVARLVFGNRALLYSMWLWRGIAGVISV